MKQKYKNNIYIFFIVVLSLLLIGMFVLVLSGWFYKDSAPSKTSLMVGGSGVMYVDGTGSEVLSYNFDGSILAGQEIKQNLSIRNSGDKKMFLRAKMDVFTGEVDMPKIDLVTAENWTKADDGYYYFDGLIDSLNTVGFLSGFKISEETQLASSSNYIIVFIVEALSSEFDRNVVWGA